MRFAPPRAHIDCSPADLDSGAVKVADKALPALRELGYVVFRIGRLRLGESDSRALGRALSTAMLGALVEDGLPASARLEFDQAQTTHVPAGFAHRTLLPHHDGQHCSYLTPSVHDDPEWEPAGRVFGDTGYTTTPAHKLYQGVFIADPGEGLSVTTYYDWLDVVRTVHATRTGGPAADVTDVIRWYGANLRRALARQPEHGCVYPSIGAMLGLDDPLWHATSFHHAEAPQENGLAADCPCGRCVGDTGRLFCHLLFAATGHTSDQFRERWEVLVPSERYDLVFGENLMTLHGGWAGGPGRLLEPMCVVVDEAAGPDYERWLAAAWRTR